MILGISSIYDTGRIRENFRRQIRLVNPNGPRRSVENVPGFSNDEVARLLIQAYGHLMNRHCSTTMLEDDGLVGTLLDGHRTPMAQTVTVSRIASKIQGHLLTWGLVLHFPQRLLLWRNCG